jgi:surface antigen
MLDAEPMGEEMPDFRTMFLSATIAATMAAVAVPASAQMLAPWFKDSVGMSDEDMTQMKGALKAAVDQKKVGATADWTSSSGRAGHVEILELFEKNGMECQTVKHSFTAGGGKTFTLPLCKVEDGSWKIAF